MKLACAFKSKSHFPTQTLAQPLISSRPTIANVSLKQPHACTQLSALESKGTVYFEDDFVDAKLATEETLKAFDQLCASVTPEQRTSLLEANRPKMAQLKQEFKMLEDELIHDD